VAQYAAVKALEMGAKVLTFSDSDGTLISRDGFSEAQVAELMHLKNVKRGRVAELAKWPGTQFEAGRRPWHVPVDIALPCATQNELDENDAKTLVANGVRCVAEGANMPSTLEAVEVFLRAGTLYAPGKASNAGGVATSGLEMSQNSLRLSWSAGEVDERLHAIMKDIHENCVRHGRRPDGSINYVTGANVAGFVKVADAMLAQGVY
jgi:glutamate dehydrogenase (NADP+)